MAVEPRPVSQQKQYDYLLKFLLVGDSDVGKQEILSELEDGSTESHFCSGGGKNSNSIDGYISWLLKKKKKFAVWDWNLSKTLWLFNSINCVYLLTAYKTTTILLDGKRVKLQLWDTSGQGRFCTIIRSYSRGAQGIMLVYDITNKWSFDGIDRWLKEVEEVSMILDSVFICKLATHLKSFCL